MKIRRLGAELFQTDGRTDGRMDKANSRFSLFCKAPEKETGCSSLDDHSAF
jgi:hypothetical protein